MNKVYISGPIKNNPNYIQCFAAAEKMLNNHVFNYQAVNPATLAHDHGKTYTEYMKEDTKALLNCDFIYMLPGWEDSKGAKFELKVAEMCGIQRVGG